MNQYLIRILMVGIGALILYLGGRFLYMYIILSQQKKYRYKQGEHLKCIQVKIAKNSTAKGGDSETTVSLEMATEKEAIKFIEFIDTEIATKLGLNEKEKKEEVQAA